MDRIPDVCLLLISSFLLPSEQNILVDADILTLDQIKRCVCCNVQAAEWYGKCNECYMFRVCPECGLIPSKNTRYEHPIGLNKRIPNVCEDCYEQGVPIFNCLFCTNPFFALDGHRIVIECDSHPYEHVICQYCIDKAFSINRWNHQWVTISIRSSAYGAKLWYGPQLSIPMLDYFGIDQSLFSYRPDLVQYMQQSKNAL